MPLETRGNLAETNISLKKNNFMKLLKSIFVLAITFIATGNLYAQDVAGQVMHFAVSGSKLLVGGQFEKADRRIVNNIAWLEGDKWAGLSKGVNGYVTDLSISGNNIFVAGEFSYADKSDASKVDANRIAMWDGTKWSGLGSPTVDRQIFALASSGNTTYIGGNFQKVGGTIATKGVAKWDGKKWSDVGNAQFDKAILGMAMLGNDLYVGGIFTINGDEPMGRVAKWDGTKWSELGNRGVDGTVTRVVSDGKHIYAVGKFIKSGEGADLNRIAMWDGSKWVSVGGGVNGEVKDIFIDGDNIYIAGAFTKAGEGKKAVDANYIAKWDGSKWSGFPEIKYVNMLTVAVVNGIVYAGGRFDGTGADQYGGIAKFENGKWSKVTAW